MPSRMVKMRADLPFHLENRFVNKWGFVIDKRMLDYTLFKKTYISDKSDDGLKRTIRASVNAATTTTTNTATTTVDTKIIYPEFGTKHTSLSAYQKKALERRCDNIVNFFPDPFSVPESVRARLTIMMQKLMADEAQFVLEFMDENFPIVDKGH